LRFGPPKVYPDAHTELNFKEPLPTARGDVLSAQDTDKRVNWYTQRLYSEISNREKISAGRAAGRVRKRNLNRPPRGFTPRKTKGSRGLRAHAENHGLAKSETMEETNELPGLAAARRRTWDGQCVGKTKARVGHARDPLVQRLASQKTRRGKIEPPMMKLGPREMDRQEPLANLAMDAAECTLASRIVQIESFDFARAVRFFCGPGPGKGPIDA